MCRGAGVLNIASNDVVVEVGLWNLLSGVYCHLTGKECITTLISAEGENYMTKSTTFGKTLLFSIFNNSLIYCFVF